MGHYSKMAIYAIADPYFLAPWP